MSPTLTIVLRLVHVVGGILWGGGAIAYLFFVKPAAQTLGSSAPEFMRTLVERRKYPMFMQAASGLTILAGAVLFWQTSGGFNPVWLKSATGIGFTTGAGAALIAFLAGNVVVAPATRALVRIGQEIAAAGKPPAPDQARQLQGLQNRIAAAERITFIMLAIAMVTMATARYWSFLAA